MTNNTSIDFYFRQIPLSYCIFILKLVMNNRALCCDQFCSQINVMGSIMKNCATFKYFKIIFIKIILFILIAPIVSCDQNSWLSRIRKYIEEYYTMLKMSEPYEVSGCCCWYGTRCVLFCDECNGTSNGGGITTYNTENKFIADSNASFFRYHVQNSNSALGCAFMHLRARHRLENGADITSYNIIRNNHPSQVYSSNPVMYFPIVYNYMNYYCLEILGVGGGCNQCYGNDPMYMGIIEGLDVDRQHANLLFEGLSKSLDRIVRVQNCLCELYYYNTGIMLEFQTSSKTEHQYAYGVRRLKYKPYALNEGCLIYVANPFGSKYDPYTYSYYDYDQFTWKNFSEFSKCLCDRAIILDGYSYPNYTYP